MRKIITAALVILQVASYAQAPDELFRSLVDAENNFAALSKTSGTRTAFLAYLTDSTILFEKGSPGKGRASWQNRPADSSLLLWWPVFAGISVAGNMGFSTGPWQWSPGRDTVQPAAQGYYATIWQKTDEGWKMAADIGISFPDTVLDRIEVYNASGPVIHYKMQGHALVAKQLLKYDKQYIQQLNRASVSFLPAYFSTYSSLVERDGQRPCQPTGFPAAAEQKESFRFEQTGGGLSSSELFGYTYGIVSITTIADGKPAVEKKCFLRIWQREPEWKIVLDVIGGN